MSNDGKELVLFCQESFQLFLALLDHLGILNAHQGQADAAADLLEKVDQFSVKKALAMIIELEKADDLLVRPYRDERHGLIAMVNACVPGMVSGVLTFRQV